MGSAHDGARTWTYDSYDIWTLEYFLGSWLGGCVWLDDYTMMEVRIGLRSFGISAGWRGIGGLDWAHSLLVAIIAMKFNSLISTQCVRFENDPWCYTQYTIWYGNASPAGCRSVGPLVARWGHFVTQIQLCSIWNISTSPHTFTAQQLDELV